MRNHNDISRHLLHDFDVDPQAKVVAVCYEHRLGEPGTLWIERVDGSTAVISVVEDGPPRPAIHTVDGKPVMTLVQHHKHQTTELDPAGTNA